jgi:hypothetical protein
VVRLRVGESFSSLFNASLIAIFFNSFLTLVRRQAAALLPTYVFLSWCCSELQVSLCPDPGGAIHRAF